MVKNRAMPQDVISEAVAAEESRQVEEAAGAPLIKQVIKATAVILFVLGGIYLIYLSPLRTYLHEVGKVQDTLQRTGIWAPVLFVLVSAVLICFGLPRLIVCPIAGAVFGFAWGLLLSQLGTLLGSYATFVFVRWGGRAFVMRRWPLLLGLTGVFERKGFVSVFLARQLPVGGVFVNMVLALTPVRHGAFLLGTLAGILPEAIPATLLGAGAIEMMGNQGIWKSVLGLAVLITVWIVFAQVARKSKMASLVLKRAKILLGKKGDQSDEEK